MTVISRKQQNYYYQTNHHAEVVLLDLFNSNTNSDWSLSSSNSSAINNVVPIPKTTIHKNLGKRKQRRFNNTWELENKEVVNKECSQMVPLFNEHNTPIKRLMEDREALFYWYRFVDLSEEKQEKLISSVA